MSTCLMFTNGCYCWIFQLFCSHCSSNSVPLPQFGHAKPVRVCNRCYMFRVTPFTTMHWRTIIAISNVRDNSLVLQTVLPVTMFVTAVTVATFNVIVRTITWYALQNFVITLAAVNSVIVDSQTFKMTCSCFKDWCTDCGCNDLYAVIYNSDKYMQFLF